MLRTLIVLVILAFGFRHAFRGPFYALLLYLWLAYFRPDQWLWWDFILPLRIPIIVGLWLIAGMMFATERLRTNSRYWLFPILLVHSLASTALSPVADYSWPFWVEFAKIIIICTAIAFLVSSEERLRLALLVIAFSLGAEGAKQGFSNLILNPGGRNINTSLMMGDNNGVAVGMAMLVPLLLALAATSLRRFERITERAMAVGVLFRAFFTYSRGGFLAILAVGLHFLLRARRRVLAIVISAVLAIVTVQVLPQEFWDRMNTIPTNTDQKEETMERSAASRLHFWRVAVDMANANPIFGVGHNAFNRSFDKYDFLNGEFGRGRSVHSLWFGVLAELGYVGFGLFMAIIVGGFLSLRRVRRLAKTTPGLQNVAIYATGVEAALLAYAVGGSFVPAQYNEFAWHLFALSVAITRVAEDIAAKQTPVFDPAVAVPSRIVTSAARRRQGLA